MAFPHLLSPVVTEVDKAAQVLFGLLKRWAALFALCEVGARDIIRYNEYLAKAQRAKAPLHRVIVDEMADLMMAAPKSGKAYLSFWRRWRVPSASI
jgi:S-DNA-T family DNA segregation ATPase FtsK/SpoIIIE